VLAIADGGPSISLWSIADGSLARTISIGEDATASAKVIGFSRLNGSLVVGDSRGNVGVFEPSSGHKSRGWHAHDSPVEYAVVSDDGRLLATTAFPKGVVRIWDLQSEALLREMPFGSGLGSPSFSAEGNILAGGVSAEAQLWDHVRGSLRSIAYANLRSCDFSPDGKWFAMGSFYKTIKVWDAAVEQERMVLLGHTGAIGTLAFSPDGKTLVSGSNTGQIKLWDMSTGQELFELPGLPGGVEQIAFSPDGQVLATAGYSRDGLGEVWLWFGPRPAERKE
jgi:WD40 repeat protein